MMKRDLLESDKPAEGNRTENFARGICTSCAHYTTPRMCCGSAQVEAANGGMIIRESRYWSTGKELIQCHRALKNIPPRQIKCPFEIERRQNLSGQHGTLKVRRVLVQERKATIGKTFSQVVPVACA